MTASHRMSAAAIALAAIFTLSGCGKGGDLTSFSATPAPSAMPSDTQVNLRGNDFNHNGIRDEIESATGAMTDDLQTRLRLLSFAWSLQQGLEVAMLGDDSALAKSNQITADVTACVTATESNASLAQNLVDIYQMTADSPLRKDAWANLRARTGTSEVTPSAAPCKETDILATTILGQTRDKMQAAAAVVAASAPSVPASAPD